MSAFVRHEFERGFLLDEERIRKINEILNRRLTGLEDRPRPTYRIYRADAFSYTTLDVQDVISEENSEWQRITKLIVSVHCDDRLDLTLEFDEDGNRLRIEGENRDFVYLLFSDLRQYISNEVNILRGLQIPSRFSSLILNALMLIILFGFIVRAWWSTGRITSSYITTLLQSQDIQEKLNFLIKSQQTSTSFYPFSLIMLVILLFILIVQTWGNRLRMIAYLFPRNIFLFGKELDRYAKIQALRSKLFWGVIVASVVSIATGLVLWRITSP